MRPKRFAMTVDTRKCVACKACVLSCAAENGLPEGYARNWIIEEIRGEFPILSAENRSERCNHCADAPCVSACPTGASHYEEGGIVMVAEEACTGCKACVASCPYDARYIHPEGHADKCTFCFHRVRAGGEPSCVSTCPTTALAFGDRNDPDSAVSRLLRTRKWKVRHPEAGTEPNVFFLE